MMPSHENIDRFTIVLENIESQVGLIAENQLQMETRFDAKLESLRFDLKGDIQVLSQAVKMNSQAIKRLDHKIDNVEDHLTQRIDDVEEGLTKRIDGVEEGLTKRIDGVEEGLTKRIDGVEEGLTKRIDGVEEGLTSVVQRLDRIEDKMDHVIDRVDVHDKDIQRLKEQAAL